MRFIASLFVGIIMVLCFTYGVGFMGFVLLGSAGGILGCVGGAIFGLMFSYVFFWSDKYYLLLRVGSSKGILVGSSKGYFFCSRAMEALKKIRSEVESSGGVSVKNPGDDTGFTFYHAENSSIELIYAGKGTILGMG